MASGSKKVIYAALFGNLMIFITKLGASIYTGSSAMLSEAIHSFVDTGNQGLLLYGLKRAKKPADEMHPFGYGMELYFWSFVVAIVIFAIGSGISFYEGFSKIMNPHPVKDPFVNYIVLSGAILFEGWAWSVAFKEFRKTKGQRSYINAVRHSKDPTIFTVLFEDTAAMLGLIVALVGIYLSVELDMPVLDACVSIIIGVILAATAILLAYETKGLLIGEGAGEETVKNLRKIISSDKSVKNVNELLTMHMGPEEILLNVSIDFDEEMSSSDVELAVSNMELLIKSKHPKVKRIFIEAQSFKQHLKDKIKKK